MTRHEDEGRKIQQCRLAIWVKRHCCALLLTALGPCVVGCQSADTGFAELVIDAENAGDCKTVGDIDNDGFVDIVLGGSPGEDLAWYRYPDWQRTVMATPGVEFTTDCAVADIDGDADVDVIVPDGNTGINLLWFENPGKAARASKTWNRHPVGQIGDWGKDVRVADFDGDGRVDIAARSRDRLLLFSRQGNDWTPTVLTEDGLGREGLAAGDIDADGDTDLVIRGAWLENPGKPGHWPARPIGDAPAAFKAVVSDFNGDGRADVAFSAAEGPGPLRWYAQLGGGRWNGQVILEDLPRAHTLQAADIDTDGDVDLLAAQMHTAPPGRILALINEDDGRRWHAEPIGKGGLHNGAATDIDNDGDVDLLGANWTGNPPLRLWLNRRTQRAAGWAVSTITNDHVRTFGLGFGDISGDGRTDIVSGPSVYEWVGAPGRPAWRHSELPAGLHAFATLDIGENARAIVAQTAGDELAIRLLMPAAAPPAAWPTVEIGTLPTASHRLGAQGYRVAMLRPGELPQIVMSSGAGIYLFENDGDPRRWSREHISANPSDEGVAVADIDADGLPDVLATTGVSKRVEWYRNPGIAGATWSAQLIGELRDYVFPDRIAAADLNGDGRVDVVVSEENGGDGGARTDIFIQTASSWERRRLTLQGSTNSLDAGDIDRDGDIDLVTAEHRGERRLILWINDGDGHFQPRQLSRDREAHLGARLMDIDGDGRLDITNIGYDEPGLMWTLLNSTEN